MSTSRELVWLTAYSSAITGHGGQQVSSLGEQASAHADEAVRRFERRFEPRFAPPPLPETKPELDIVTVDAE